MKLCIIIILLFFSKANAASFEGCKLDIRAAKMYRHYVHLTKPQIDDILSEYYYIFGDVRICDHLNDYQCVLRHDLFSMINGEKLINKGMNNYLRYKVCANRRQAYMRYKLILKAVSYSLKRAKWRLGLTKPPKYNKLR